METCNKSMAVDGQWGDRRGCFDRPFEGLRLSRSRITNHKIECVYGFSRCDLLFVHSYLDNRKQKVKVNGSFSTWTKTSLGVPQVSVLEPPLFNIYLNDLFLFLEETEVCNYADDTTICTYLVGKLLKIRKEWRQRNKTMNQHTKTFRTCVPFRV